MGWKFFFANMAIYLKNDTGLQSLWNTNRKSWVTDQLVSVPMTLKGWA